MSTCIGLEVAVIGRWVDCCVAGVYLHWLRGGCYRQVGAWIAVLQVSTCTGLEVAAIGRWVDC